MLLILVNNFIVFNYIIFFCDLNINFIVKNIENYNTNF